MDKFGKCLGEVTGSGRYLADMIRHMMIESNSWYTYEVDGESILEFRYPTNVTFMKKSPDGFIKYRKNLLNE